MKLCVDPGHGNSNRVLGKYDPGASAGGLEEADVALAFGLTLRWMLPREGIPVWMTRDDDSDPAPVGQRDDRAEAAGCSHFLSLHCNAGGGSGVETFYRDSRDKRLAAVAHRAALVATGLSDRGIRHESLTAVRRLAVMDFDGPCALVELGYIDRLRDRRILVRRDVRIRFAEALAEGLKAL